MTKIFTDEDGSEFEFMTDIKMPGFNGIVIKPVVKEDKQTLPYQLNFIDFDDGNILIEKNYDLTPDQAKAVSEAIEALMEYVTADVSQYSSLTQKDVASKATRAREALND